MDNAIFSAFSKVAELNRTNDSVITTLPLSVLVSLSNTSQGQPVRAVNTAIERFLTGLQKDDSLSSQLELSLLSSQQYVTVLRPLESIEQGLAIPMFSAKGDERALAQGIEVAVNMLRSKVSQAQKTDLPCRRPWLLVITDGQGTDVWQDTAIRLKHWSEEKAIIPIIINIGQCEDSLNEYSSIPVFQDAITLLDDILNWARECLQMVTNAEHGQTVHLPNPPVKELA
jgi:uncharacterized protein YegL